ncbi:AAA family ATPase [Nocardia brasiliensis]|uniref:AAA family ATPase n=1 Tax=Nocardia brasiliensis TaxID=37326 RepID=A0A6G9XY78_NOCBR|nr:AAA family ATPase [Nocardia brasiliensis]QIS05892.1 AAA family ATPase [Nocardia brasiliensis]
MTELVITRGYPGCGKTTYALNWVAAQSGRARVNRDDLRAMLFNGEGILTDAQECDVTAAQKSMAASLLDQGTSVIVDDTNLRLRVACNWADLAHEHGAAFQCVDFHTDAQTCIERNRARQRAGQRYVPHWRILDIANRFPLDRWAEVTARTVPAVEPYVPDISKPEAWIFDLDGTLAHMRARNPYDFSRVGEDDVDHVVRHVYETLSRDETPSGAPVMIVVSGRKAMCMDLTQAWLHRHWIYADQMYMRADDDNRPDHVVKLEIFNEYIRHHYNVLGVFDDRNSVVAMWRRLGLKCFHVAEGNF